MAQFVMVIDDSLVIRKILETCLHRAGYEVKSFPDGVEALCWLNTSEARIPDLVVVDLGLPKLDGYQVIQLIKADRLWSVPGWSSSRGAMESSIASKVGWLGHMPM